MPRATFAAVLRKRTLVPERIKRDREGLVERSSRFPACRRLDDGWHAAGRLHSRRVVGVVVVTWRSNPRALSCIERVRETLPEGAVVLVDNEAAEPRLKTSATVLAQGDNLGFAAGANLGIAHAVAAGASHAVLLNDDVLVEPGCLAALVAAAGEERAVSPAIDAPRADAFAGGRIDWKRGFGSHEAGALDFLTGAALCIPRGVWERVGPFNEQLFLYYEDVDWSRRALAAGVELHVALDARATHEAGSSAGGETWAYYSTRNRLWFLQTYVGLRAARREAVRTSWRARLRAVRSSERAVAQAKLAGVEDWSAGRLGKGPYPR